MHFVPIDHDEMNEKDMLYAESKKPPTVTDRLKNVFGGLAASNKKISGHEQDNHDAVSRTMK